MQIDLSCPTRTSQNSMTCFIRDSKPIEDTEVEKGKDDGTKGRGKDWPKTKRHFFNRIFPKDQAFIQVHFISKDDSWVGLMPSSYLSHSRKKLLSATSSLQRVPPTLSPFFPLCFWILKLSSSLPLPPYSTKTPIPRLTTSEDN